MVHPTRRYDTWGYPTEKAKKKVVVILSYPVSSKPPVYFEPVVPFKPSCTHGVLKQLCAVSYSQHLEAIAVLETSVVFLVRFPLQSCKFGQVVALLELHNAIQD